MNEVVQVRMNGWAAMVKQKNESGMTVKEWCAADGITQYACLYRCTEPASFIQNSLWFFMNITRPEAVSIPRNSIEVTRVF